MTKKLNWRLNKLPTPDEVRELVKDKIITQDEAREILFSEYVEEVEEGRDKKSLESEIKFLRELVEKLSKSSSTIVETIRYIDRPYHQWEWYKPYQVWCGSITGAAGITGVNNSIGSLTGMNALQQIGATSANGNIQTAQSGFSAIATF